MDNLDLISEKYQNAVGHIRPDCWEKANRHLVKKILTEFFHEKIIALEENANGCYQLAAGGNLYTFKAKTYRLDHIDIDADSIRKTTGNIDCALNAVDLVLELREKLEISDALLPVYLDEITATLSSKAYKIATPRPSASELIRADFQTVETSMDEGHPVFIANNGRMGFDTFDYLAHAPECGTPQHLVWIAAHKSKTVFSCGSDLTYSRLIEQELPDETVCRFEQKLKRHTVNPEEYYWMPVHPWQWREKIATRFAHDIAERNIVFLGIGTHQYLAQQSIRTWFNISEPNQYYVKTALSILNMGFMRGLSPYFMSKTPQINDWVDNLLSQDPYFKQKGFSILKEVAAIGFKDTRIEASIVSDTPYKKMLSALWRENPLSKINPSQRLMTMASLLHTDNAGGSVLVELIKDSGLAPNEWLKRYLDVYLCPLLHAYFQYDLLFMPHGENVILILENSVPVGAFMKDIGEEIGIVNSTSVSVPDELARIVYTIKEEMKENHIFLDVFDCFFRFMPPLLGRENILPEDEFWSCVADCIKAYQQAFPGNEQKYRQYNLFKEGFILNCMNRLQLNNNQQMVEWGDWEKNFRFAGIIRNPLLSNQ